MKRSQDEFVAFVLDQLATLGDASARKMFGGHGLYFDRTFFGLIDDGEAYLRADDASLPDFVARGMSPFEPWPGHTMSVYWRVPPDVLENGEMFASWSRRAIAAARTAKAAKAPRRSKPARKPTTGDAKSSSSAPARVHRKGARRAR